MSTDTTNDELNIKPAATIEQAMIRCKLNNYPHQFNLLTGEIKRVRHLIKLPKQGGFRYFSIVTEPNHLYCSADTVKAAKIIFRSIIEKHKAKLQQVRIGVCIPTRGDRPQFIEQAKRLIEGQTQKPDEILFVDYAPRSEAKDLAQRHKHGLKELFAKGCDVVFLWEDDDWYAADYIETMMRKWEELKRPVLLGLSTTTYYHIGIRKFGQWNDQKRACAFHTLVSKDAQFDVCNDDAIDFDRKLWHANEGLTFAPEKPLCLGIKHGVGLSGGSAHNPKWKLYGERSDADWKFFDSIVTTGGEFYKQLHA